LIRKNTFYCCYGVFKVRVSSSPREDAPGRTVSQNSTAWNSSRSTLFQASPGHRTANSAGHRRARTPAGVKRSGIP